MSNTNIKLGCEYYVSTLTDLKAVFNTLNGSVYDCPTGTVLHLMADISGIDIALDLRNVRVLHGNGKKLTCTTGGNFTMGYYAAYSTGHVSAWSAGVYTGNGTSWSGLTTEVGTTWIIREEETAPYPMAEVIAIASDTSLTASDCWEGYLASASKDYKLLKVAKAQRINDVTFDFGKLAAITSDWYAGCDAVYTNVHFVNKGNGTGDAGLLFKYVYNLKFVCSKFMNFSVVGDYVCPTTVWRSGWVYYNMCEFTNLHGNGSSGTTAPNWISYGIGMTYIGCKICFCANLKSGITYIQGGIYGNTLKRAVCIGNTIESMVDGWGINVPANSDSLVLGTSSNLCAIGTVTSATGNTFDNNYDPLT